MKIFPKIMKQLEHELEIEKIKLEKERVIGQAGPFVSSQIILEIEKKNLEIEKKNLETMKLLTKEQLDNLSEKLLNKCYIIPKFDADYLVIEKFELDDMSKHLSEESGHLFLNVEALKDI